jgi:membrane peptidoglycan carboxypeptidase
MIKAVLAAALLAGLASPALAQTALDQNLNGIVRGIESQNTSAQVGEVMFNSNNLVVDVKGTGNKAEAVTINRGFQCSDQPGPVFAVLGMLSNGHLAARASISRDRLLSGNYLVVVHNNGAHSRAVACGQLYR